MIQILDGDCRDVLSTLADESVNCIVTSPPYFALRDYGVDGQIGLEPTPDEYVAEMVCVFREARRVLRDDGTLWLNLGDSYAGTGKSGGGDQGQRWQVAGVDATGPRGGKWKPPPLGLKRKDLIGVPWRVAFALQEDGWYLRQDIIWSKPNPMPESVTDRCTKAHEYLFLLSKSPRYYFDADAIAEPAIHKGRVVMYGDTQKNVVAAQDPKMRTRIDQTVMVGESRNRRSVWNIPSQPFYEAHFAVMPIQLAQDCIKAGCPVGGTVLDPFGGAGTTGLAADRLQRNAILIELNPKYAAMARRRIFDDASLFGNVA